MCSLLVDIYPARARPSGPYKDFVCLTLIRCKFLSCAARAIMALLYTMHAVIYSTCYSALPIVYSVLVKGQQTVCISAWFLNISAISTTKVKRALWQQRQRFCPSFNPARVPCTHADQPSNCKQPHLANTYMHSMNDSPQVLNVNMQCKPALANTQSGIGIQPAFKHTVPLLG